MQASRDTARNDAKGALTTHIVSVPNRQNNRERFLKDPAMDTRRPLAALPELPVVAI